MINSHVEATETAVDVYITKGMIPQRESKVTIRRIKRKKNNQEMPNEV